MNPIDQINGIFNGAATVAPTARWLICKLCGTITPHDMTRLPPTNCPHCGQATSFVTMPSQEKAAEMQAVMLKHLSPVSAGAAGVAVPAEPILAPMGHSNIPPKQDVLSAPKATRTRKPAAPKPEAAGVAAPDATVTGASPAPTPSSTIVAGSQDSGQTVEPADFKAIREAAINALVAKHGLNEAEVREVTHGTIFTLGFTRWAENDEGKRLPVYSFKELTDTPQSFKAELNEARSEPGGGLISIDVARVVVPVPEVAAGTWGGEVVASLKSQHGPIMASAGAKVRLGAKLSKTGRLVWFVLGITK